MTSDSHGPLSWASKGTKRRSHPVGKPWIRWCPVPREGRGGTEQGAAGPREGHLETKTLSRGREEVVAPGDLGAQGSR